MAKIKLMWKENCGYAIKLRNDTMDYVLKVWGIKYIKTGHLYSM